MLRPLIEYVRLESGAFIKKKIWDGVTGTVFNIPTKSFNESQNTENDKYTIIGRMFGHSYRGFNSPSVNDDIFPLDIRRVERTDPPLPPSSVVPPLLENGGETLLRERHTSKDLPAFNYRDMLEDDPWFVPESQQALIDHPPRRYPLPEQVYTPEIIPLDDKIFRAEFDSDQLNFTRYFVTNLHGGTILINGIEVRKGDVAGPLPNFAVIECPGGQIAFWFGCGGRHHLAGPERDSPLKWRSLRQQDGWQYTGLSTGHVWDIKIRDRLERKKKGDHEDDDDEWDELLSYCPEQKQSESITVNILYKY